MNNPSNKSSNLGKNKRPRNTQSAEEFDLIIKKPKYNETSYILDKSNQNNRNNIDIPIDNNLNLSTQNYTRKDIINQFEKKNLNKNNKEKKRIRFHPKNTKFVKKFKTLLKERNKKLDKKIPSLSDDDFFEFLKNNIDYSNLKINSKPFKMNRESSISLLGSGVEALKSCVICFDEIDFDTKHYLRCGHVFHKDCIKKWEEQESSDGTCPVCKQDIDSDRLEEDEESSEASEEIEEEIESVSSISVEEPIHNNRAHYLYMLERNIHFTVWVLIIIIFIYSVLGLHLMKNIASRQ